MNVFIAEYYQDVQDSYCQPVNVGIYISLDEAIKGAREYIACYRIKVLAEERCWERYRFVTKYDGEINISPVHVIGTEGSQKERSYEEVERQKVTERIFDKLEEERRQEIENLFIAYEITQSKVRNKIVELFGMI